MSQSTYILRNTLIASSESEELTKQNREKQREWEHRSHKKVGRKVVGVQLPRRNQRTNTREEFYKELARFFHK